jgi:hypothetical protein
MEIRGSKIEIGPSSFQNRPLYLSVGMTFVSIVRLEDSSR